MRRSRLASTFPHGRRSRQVIAVDIGDARGPADADLRLHIPPDAEVATLMRLTAAVAAPGSSTTSGIMQAVMSSIADTDARGTVRRDRGGCRTR